MFLQSRKTCKNKELVKIKHFGSFWERNRTFLSIQSLGYISRILNCSQGCIVPHYWNTNYFCLQSISSNVEFWWKPEGQSWDRGNSFEAKFWVFFLQLEEEAENNVLSYGQACQTLQDFDLKTFCKFGLKCYFPFSSVANLLNL